MKKNPIEPGDLIYFWQSGKGIAGVARAASPMYQLEGHKKPWNDSVDYKWRFDLSRIRDGSETPLSWNEIRTNTDTVAIQPPLHLRKNQEWLAQQVLGLSKAEEIFEDLLQAHRDGHLPPSGAGSESGPHSSVSSDPVPDEDTRQTAMRAIHLRQGQPQFRRLLLENYKGRCAVSGCSTEALLDAAHIKPFRGTHANVAHNGILLRTDIHTLFDTHLLTVVPSAEAFTVRVDPDVDDYYQQFDGATLAVRPGTAGAPSPRELTEHNNVCEFLSKDGS